MAKNVLFRAWFYFRQGWSTYFAFVIAALNTMVTTYYLAIKDVPNLEILFPSFLVYVVILSAIGIPLLVLVGYLHYKKSSAFKAEADINMEANPHMRRLLLNTETLLSLYAHMSEIIVKLAKNEKLTEKEHKEIEVLKNNLDDYIKRRTIHDT
jgi:hypothetical protein